MTKTNTEKSRMLRKKRAKKGLKELRGVWIPVDQEKQLKILINRYLTELKQR